jgi:hypothetical protein
MIGAFGGGAWPRAARRFMDAGSSTFGVMAVLFLPIALGTRWLYDWADAGKLALDPKLRHKAVYLNPPFFAARAALYLACWMVLARLLRRAGTEDDKARGISGPGLLIAGFTGSFAAIDWLMSLDAQWYSTIFPMIVVVSQALAATAFIAMAVLRQGGEPSAQTRIDLGNVLLALLMTWAYVGFSQYLVQWAGNLPAEVGWYHARTSGGWGVLGALLIAAAFGAPFVGLLFRDLKGHARRLATICGAVLFTQFAHFYWIIAPAHRKTAGLGFLDVLVPLGIGGVWLVFYARALCDATAEETAA